MASASDLARTLSDATGLPLATVVDIDRKLVKGKLRRVGGRRFNAAQMTALDAARLLTAILASPQANASVEAVERYSQTRVDKKRSSATLFAAANLDNLAALPARHGFVDALATLIASASTGSLAKLLTDNDEGSAPRIEVYAFTRATRGRIRLSGLPNGLTASVEYVSAAADPARKGKTGKSRDAADENAGDLEQSRRITERTIFAVGQLLAEERNHAR